MYDRNRSGYGLTHTLKVCDVLSDTQYNMSTIVRGGDFELSLWELRPLVREEGTFVTLNECSVNAEK